MFSCPKMGHRAPQLKKLDNFFTPTSPQNDGLDICFMRLPIFSQPDQIFPVLFWTSSLKCWMLIRIIFQTWVFAAFCFIFLFFLDTQVSLAPTHVSWLVGWLVRPSVGWSHFRISNLWSVTVDQIKKLKKQSPFIFEFCFWEDLPHPRKCIWRLKCSKMYMKA